MPPGLGRLTAPQRALADFLRRDDDLLAVAAQTSPPPEQVAEDPDELAAWVTCLPVGEKDKLLGRVIRDEAARVGMELLRRFHDDTTVTALAPRRRTVADLLDAAARRRADRERRLDELAGEEDAVWSRVEAMIATRKPAGYDAAVTLLTDLRALAERGGHHGTFAERTTELRRTHARKPSLIARLDRAGV